MEWCRLYVFGEFVGPRFGYFICGFIAKNSCVGANFVEGEGDNMV